MDVLGVLKKNFTVAKEVATEKAKIAKEIFTTKEQIRASKKEIRTLIFKIGQTYMELHPEDYEAAFEDYFYGIKEAKEMIIDNEARIEELKAQMKPEDAAQVDAMDDEDDEDLDVKVAVAEEACECAEEACECAEEACECAEETCECAEEACECAEEACECTEESCECTE